MRQLTDSERETMQTPLREYWVKKDGLLPKETRAFEAGFITGLDHAAAQLAALSAERDALRAEVERLENSVDTLLAFVNGKIARAELDNQINSTTTGETK